MQSSSNNNNNHLIHLPLVDIREDDPFFPLVINVITKYWGYDIHQSTNKLGNDTNKLQSKISSSLLIEGLERSKSHGFLYYVYKGTLKDLKKRIDQGIPIIVIIPGIQDMSQHALIISGYEEKEKRIITYIPQPDSYGAIPETQFLSEWNQEDNLTILIIPKEMSSIVKNDELKNNESNKLCLEAERYFQNNEYETAMRILEKENNSSNENSYFWYLFGLAANKLNDTKKFLVGMHNAIKYNPNYYSALRSLANFYLNTQDYAKANELYSRAIEINPNRYGSIFKNRAIARINLNYKKEAVEDLQTYILKVPTASDRSKIEELITELNSN